MYDGVELIGEVRLEVMTRPLPLWAVDHSDSPLETRCSQSVRDPGVPQHEQQVGYAGLVEDGLIAFRDRNRVFRRSFEMTIVYENPHGC